MADILANLSAGVIAGNVAECERLTQQALASGVPAKEILDRGLIPGMDVVGERMRKGDIFIPEVLMSARAMKASLETLKPSLQDVGVRSSGKVVIGTVKGDLHDIGKNLVSIMLQGAGFEVKDLGNDVSPEAFVAAARSEQADVVGMSALLTTTMRAMPLTIKALEEAGLRKEVKVIIGGAPVTQQYAEEIGADGYGPTAAAAVELAKRLVVART